MSNFSTLKERVLRRVIDAPTAVQTEVPLLLNNALLAIQQRYNFEAMKRSASYITTENTRLLGALPTRFKAWRDRPLLLPNEGTNRNRDLLSIQSDEDAQTEWGEDQTGRPSALALSTPTEDSGLSALNVYPLPDGLSDYSDGEYRIKLPYWGYVAPLASDGDTNWFTENAEEFLIFYATAEAFDVDWDDAAMTKYTAKREALFRQVRQLDTALKTAGTDTWVPHWRGARAGQINGGR